MRRSAEPPPAAEGGERAGAGRRRGKASTGRTIATIIVSTFVVLAMITGLSVVFFYRHLNGNVTFLDIDDQLTDRPSKADLPEGPMNILVMGSDDRDAAGNNIDGLTGGGARSDTTIMFHLSGDRETAYGISIPRDTLVDRPDCISDDGETIPGAKDAMWNEAFNLGGPACTIQQFESLTDIFIDHFVVVDFAGFRDMVDAIGGVEVCIPEDIEDPAHGINIQAGTREIKGKEALNYVRARYTLGDGSDIGRIKRQQAFVAAMVHKVLSKGMLARLDRLVRFLDAATKSLVVDENMGNVWKLARIGQSFQGIGLGRIRFLTAPFVYSEENPGRVELTPEADRLWARVRQDEGLSKRVDEQEISAGDVATEQPGGKAGSGSPDGAASPGEAGSEGATLDEEEREAREAAGLCA